MDAMSAALPMRIDLDLQLTPMASRHFRLLAVHIGNCRQSTKSRMLFRNCIKAPTDTMIDRDSIEFRFGRRTNNPFFLNNVSYDETDITVPRLMAAGCGPATCERSRQESPQLRPMGIGQCIL